MTNYYIGKDGDDGNDGLSWETRKSSLAKLEPDLKPGDVVYLAETAGKYEKDFDKK